LSLGIFDLSRWDWQHCLSKIEKSKRDYLIVQRRQFTRKLTQKDGKYLRKIFHLNVQELVRRLIRKVTIFRRRRERTGQRGREAVGHAVDAHQGRFGARDFRRLRRRHRQRERHSGRDHGAQKYLQRQRRTPKIDAGTDHPHLQLRKGRDPSDPVAGRPVPGPPEGSRSRRMYSLRNSDAKRRTPDFPRDGEGKQRIK
jgi:hypothetical protein